MIRLVVRVIGTDPNTAVESCLSEVNSDRYDPGALDAQVIAALKLAVTQLNGAAPDLLRPWQPEVSIVLTADEEAVRPSLHLSFETLKELTQAGASVDFDPYV